MFEKHTGGKRKVKIIPKQNFKNSINIENQPISLKQKEIKIQIISMLKKTENSYNMVQSKPICKGFFPAPNRDIYWIKYFQNNILLKII